MKYFCFPSFSILSNNAPQNLFCFVSNQSVTFLAKEFKKYFDAFFLSDQMLA